MTRRVVITGMGIVSPVGTGLEFAWKNLLDGVSGVREITSIDVSDLPSKIAGQPVLGKGAGECDFDIAADAKEQKRMDKTTLFALVAADQAIKDAGDFGSGDRVGVCVGGGIGGLQNMYDVSVELEKNGPRFVSPFFIPKVLINMPAGHISIKYGYRGPNVSLVTACATGTHSIGEGARLIAHGDADVMICGGTEAAVCRVGIAGFCAMRALSTNNENPTAASRPWDDARDGFVIAEGAGILVLEEYEHATQRGAKIYAEVSGYGMSGDAHHITAPAPNGNGGLRAMRAALNDAGLNPSDVDYINAHGTSTGLGDAGELSAVKTLFDGVNVSMSSTKSMTGHLLGAAGAAEAIFSALSIRDQIVPPTINLDNPMAEAAGVDLVPNVAKKRRVDVALSNSFGFGGTNASIVLKKI
ncbi:MAG: beta-ketoacyl-ACP synthase II [Rickettsiales bacterium]|nr:beta-ketoacyl-ACP synthase II [Rickettsiales bacterium]